MGSRGGEAHQQVIELSKINGPESRHRVPPRGRIVSMIAAGGLRALVVARRDIVGERPVTRVQRGVEPSDGRHARRPSGGVDQGNHPCSGRCGGRRPGHVILMSPDVHLVVLPGE